MGSKLTECDACGAEIVKGGKCPKCGKDHRGFFKKHKILTGLLILMLLSVFISAMGGGDDTPDTGEVASNSAEVNKSVETPQNIVTVEEPVVETPITPDVAPVETPITPEVTPVVTDTATLGEKNAASKALDYLGYSAFSYSGLVKQLEFEGYTHKEAVYGVDKCGVDWKEQAASKALDYLGYSAFSSSGLVKQLEFEGYTSEEAIYGVDRCGADWNEQAALKAKDYIEYSSFSRSELINQLEFEGFTRAQAEYGVQAIGY